MKALADALALIVAERDRQAVLVTRGKIPGRCDDEHVTDLARLGALTEEVGEVARCLNEYISPLDELVQVAAVALGWILWETR